MSSLTLLFSAITGCQTGVMAGFEAFKVIAQLNVVSGGVTSILMVSGAFQFGTPGAVMGLVVATGFTCVLNGLVLREQARLRRIPLRYQKCLSEWRILWNFSLPTALCGAMHGPVNWVCVALLVNQPNGYGQLGIFNAANQWFGMLLFFPQLLGQAVLPVLSERVNANDVSQSKKILFHAMWFTGVAILPVVAVTVLSARHIMTLYGSTFSGGSATLVIVILTGWLVAIITPVGQVMAAVSRMWTGFLMNLGWAIVVIVMTSLLVANGAVGLAAARGGAYIIHSIWVLGFAYLILSRGQGRTALPTQGAGIEHSRKG